MPARKGTRTPGKFCSIKFSKQDQIELYRFTRKRYTIYKVKEIPNIVKKRRNGLCWICPKEHECKFDKTNITTFFQHIKELEKKLSKQLIYFIGERRVRQMGPRKYNNSASLNSSVDSLSSDKSIKSNGISNKKTNFNLNKSNANKKKSNAKLNVPIKSKANNSIKLDTKIAKKVVKPKINESAAKITKPPIRQNGKTRLNKQESINLSINSKSKVISKNKGAIKNTAKNKLSKVVNGKSLVAGYEKAYKNIQKPLTPVSKESPKKSPAPRNDLEITPKSKPKSSSFFTSTPIPIFSPVISLFNRLIPYSSSK